MNYNILAYFIYFIVTTATVIKVGIICYTNGNTFVANLLPDDLELSKKINTTLLVGYYLLNLGYCATTLISWTTITNSQELIEMVCAKTATILFIIGILHYINIISIIKFIKSKQ